MKTILVLGAGRSSSVLISYLLKTAAANDWHVVVGDLSEEVAREKVGDSRHGHALYFTVEDSERSRASIASADVVISLLPADYHPIVAKHCLAEKKHLLTASYVSDQMKSFQEEAKTNGLLFLNECGLDPGLDHMSAMQVIDTIRKKEGKLISFESFTGGLIAPDTDPDNPWRYKFTWNPRNVVLAGQGEAKFLYNGILQYVPYKQLFTRITSVDVPGYGAYEGYANRDSLQYMDTYGLQSIETMLRGTLRCKGFCSAWNVFVQLGCCDDTTLVDNVSTLTHRGFIRSFLKNNSTESIEDALALHLNIERGGPEVQKLKWSGFFDDEPVGLQRGTPAQIVEHILNKRWKLDANDKDMIVMWHRFVYTIGGIKKEVQASLVCTGDDSVNTAMAKTVGLPLGIAAKLLLQDTIQQRGVVIPVQREIYDPILRELKEYGVALEEREMVYTSPGPKS